MNIQTIRGFLHAHDESAAFKILGWLSMCYGVGGSEIVDTPDADALAYFEASLTPDIRAAAINTVMRAIEAVVARPPIIQEWKYSDGSTLPATHAPYYMAQAQVVHIQRLGSTRDSDSVRLFRENKADLHALVGEGAKASFVGGKTVETIEISAARWDEKAIRHDYMDRVCADLNRRIRERGGPAAQVEVWQTDEYKQGSDRRRRVWDRVTAFGDALCASSLRHGAPLGLNHQRETFWEWARFEYARTAVGFLIGPARTR